MAALPDFRSLPPATRCRRGPPLGTGGCRQRTPARNFLRENFRGRAGRACPGDEAAAAGSGSGTRWLMISTLPGDARGLRPGSRRQSAARRPRPGRCRDRSGWPGCWSWSAWNPSPRAGEEDLGTRRSSCSRQETRARADKDWARADEIRDSLAELGWEVRDGAEGARLVPCS